jgi:hypothetical protein
MATNRESKSSTRANVATGTSGMSSQGERPGTTGRAGNGSVATGNGPNGGASSPGFLGGIQQKVTSQVDQQKNRAADGLGGIANAIRNASNELRTENEAVAAYVDSASDALRRWADQIREKGVADMLDDVQVFARRRPAVFVGGAFLVGLGLARFLKSTSDRHDYEPSGSEGFSDIDPMTAPTVTPSYGVGSPGTGY